MAQLDRIRVASPCPVGWEQMTGDDRVRFCAECQLNVYNFSELTRTEAENLLRTTEGRICGRLYRRTDGTIITKDCPVGLRAVRQRAVKIATAAFGLLVSLCSTAIGQQRPDKDKACKQQIRIATKVADVPSESATLAGTIVDPNGAVVPGAEIKIVDHNEKSQTLRSNDEGRFSLSGLAPGIYQVLIDAPGFLQLKVAELKLAAGTTAVVEATLLINGAWATTGIVSVEPPLPRLLDTPNMTIFKGDQIQRIPRP